MRVDGTVLGLACGPRDVIEFLRRAGAGPDRVGLQGPDIAWRGGGPDVWAPPGITA
ncbi:hypothetical protein [Streptomyces sp. NPDC059788]|uniref:hypothetical protein n=1 Tax=Streptomyces sp. NPDC059788 TaxID=3346948 RepID=UPI003667F3CD